ncbi:hypothetical protein [Formosa sp. 4Alg 33]|uniref:hypothetical protein n=1 Tax=Formosa sp. 4Alg 33 TaxID=3382189 RepID=UPI003D9C21E8
MKHLLILLVAVICFSCSSDDDGNGNQRFHPPTWIQGTWIQAGSQDLNGVKFTTDDFCVLEAGLESCYKSIIEQSELDVYVEDEEITDTDYEFEINYYGEPGVERELEFHFRLKSDNEIVEIENGLETNTYTKQ